MFVVSPTYIFVAMIFTAAQPDTPILDTQSVVGDVTACQKIHKAYMEKVYGKQLGSPITKVYAGCAPIANLQSLKESVDKEIQRRK